MSRYVMDECVRSEEIVVDLVEIGAELRVLFLELLAIVPLLKRLMHVVLANLKHSFGIGATCLLQAPGRGVVKAETTGARARVLLLEVVAHLETREGLSLTPEGISAIVVAANALSLHPVLCSVLSRFRARFGGVATDRHVENDVLVRVHNLHALIDSRGQIDIPNGASVHEHVVFNLLRRENNGDRP